MGHRTASLSRQQLPSLPQVERLVSDRKRPGECHVSRFQSSAIQVAWTPESITFFNGPASFGNQPPVSHGHLVITMKAQRASQYRPLVDGQTAILLLSNAPPICHPSANRNHPSDESLRSPEEAKQEKTAKPMIQGVHLCILEGGLVKQWIGRDVHPMHHPIEPDCAILSL